MCLKRKKVLNWSVFLMVGKALVTQVCFFAKLLALWVLVKVCYLEIAVLASRSEGAAE